MTDDGMESRAVSLLVYAFRYALGRSTYAVSEVAEALLAAAVSLSPSTRSMIADEITTAIDTDRAGMNMDAQQWAVVRERMRTINADEGIS